MSFKATAPGSLMVLGEYAVLHGRSALVGAINKRMTVTLHPRVDQTVRLVSALGEYVTELATLAPVSPFQFVLTALGLFADRLETGFDLVIESEFSSTMGFSSSAAVTVATLAVVQVFLGEPVSLEELALEARTVIRKVQGNGSGADAAACVMGGLIAYSAAPFLVEKLPSLFPVSVRYSGNKIPTPQVLEFVRERFYGQEIKYQEIISEIGQCSDEGIAAVRRADWQTLGRMMDRQQVAMAALGVSNDRLDGMLRQLRAEPGVFGAKISGAGLGDCVIGVGGAAEEASFSAFGVVCEAV